jgi:hypothetical protein
VTIESRFLRRATVLARLDLTASQPQPRYERLAVASLLAIVGSLIADAILVRVGTAVFPSIGGYGHLRFDDYAKLTVIGVMLGCAGWPVLTRISWAPRWLFARLAVLASLVLFLPDVWLLIRGQPAQAVLVLMAMHVAVMLVTYNALVRIAPAGRKRESNPDARDRGS